MSVRRRASDRAHYNYFRDYDPASGRYVESDPIGLVGGLNSYSYVENNPIAAVDPLGLQRRTVVLMPPTISESIAAVRVPELLRQIQRYDSTFRYAVNAPPNWRYSRQDVEYLRELTEQYEKANAEISCSLSPRRINYGATPNGIPFSRHWGAEHGPPRNIPGSVVDWIVATTTPVAGRNNTRVYYDSLNDLSVITGRNGIVTAHPGLPTKTDLP